MASLLAAGSDAGTPSAASARSFAAEDEADDSPLEAIPLPSEMARTDPPEAILLLANIQKQKNAGQVIRSACAFNAGVVFTGDRDRISSFGAKGAEKHVPLHWGGPKVRDAIAKLKARGFTVVGIEITPDAKPIHLHPFKGPTVFIPGSEGEGMPKAHQELCDQMVYIPQAGNGTASLNVNVAVAICLHHFSVWANYQERPREGEKFVVLPPAPKGGGGRESEVGKARKALRDAENAKLAAAAEEVVGGIAGLGWGGAGEEAGEDEDSGRR